MKHLILIAIFLSSIAVKGQIRITDSIRPASVQRKLDSNQTAFANAVWNYAVAVSTQRAKDSTNFLLLRNRDSIVNDSLRKIASTNFSAQNVAASNAAATASSQALVAQSTSNSNAAAIGRDSIRINTNTTNIATLSSGKLDVTAAAATYYLASNPTQFITNAALSPYALSSGVPTMAQFTNLKNTNDSLRLAVIAKQDSITRLTNQVASLTSTAGTLPIYNTTVTLTSAVTTYTVNHSLGYKPAAIVPVSTNNVAATSPNINPNSITATSFQVSFAGVPTVASITANGATLTLYYLAIK